MRTKLANKMLEITAFSRTTMVFACLLVNADNKAVMALIRSLNPSPWSYFSIAMVGSAQPLIHCRDLGPEIRARAADKIFGEPR